MYAAVSRRRQNRAQANMPYTAELEEKNSSDEK